MIYLTVYIMTNIHTTEKRCIIVYFPDGIDDSFTHRSIMIGCNLVMPCHNSQKRPSRAVPGQFLAVFFAVLHVTRWDPVKSIFMQI